MTARPARRRPAARAMLVRVAFGLAYVAFLALLFEGAARLLVGRGPRRGPLARRPRARARRRRSAAELEAIGRQLGLDPYEMADPDRPGRWRLRPGYRATVAELLEAKRRDGKLLTVRRIEEEAPRLGLRPDDVAVESTPPATAAPSSTRPARGCGC